MAGKQTICPSCGARMTIPESAPAAGFPQQTAPPSGWSDPLGTAPSYTAYQPPGAASYAPAKRTAADTQLLGPAIGMMVGAGLSLLLVLLRAIIGFATGWEEFSVEPPKGDPAETMGFYIGLYASLILLFGVFPLVSLLNLLGAILMVTRKSYSWAMAGAIAAVLPCQCCFPVTVPFGIWGLVRLRDPSVKRSFR